MAKSPLRSLVRRYPGSRPRVARRSPCAAWARLACHPIGQVTPIHDHVTWCVFGVLQGAEHEELYAVRDGGWLEQTGSNVAAVGEVSGFAPPGDIHRVRNCGDGVAISLHVYGADITRLGSSVRRTYDLPVLGASG